MMTNAPVEPTIGPAEVARLAGVSASTVSNWRARDLGFPEPVTANTSRPLFRLADVEDWLTLHAPGKSRTRSDRPAYVLVNMLRGRISADNYVDVVLPVLCAVKVLRDESPGRAASLRSLSSSLDEVTTLLTSHGRFLGQAFANALDILGPSAADVMDALAAEVKPGDDLAAVAEDLLALSTESTRHNVNVHSTGPQLARLIAGLVPDEARDVADLACGAGDVLRTIAEAHPEIHLIGRDISDDALQLVACRFFLERISADLEHSDLLHPTNGSYNAVVIDGPLGLRLDESELAAVIPLPFGHSKANRGETVWAQLAFRATNSGGTAIVLTTEKSLAAQRNAPDVFREMLFAGVVEAVISLPARALQRTSIPTQILVLRNRIDLDATEPVLMIDLAEVDGRRGLAPSQVDDMNIIVRNWREDRLGLNSNAVAVPVRELAELGAPRTPRAWLIAKRPVDLGGLLISLATAESAFATAQAEISTLRHAPIQLVEREHPAELHPLDSLLEVVRSFLTSTSEGEGHPVRMITPKSVRTGEIAERNVKTLPSESSDLRTKSGDVAVAVVGSEIVTRVLTEAGLVVDSNVQLVRDPAGRFDPHVLAQLLRTESNQALVSDGVITRVEAGKLRVPLLPLDEQARLSAVIRQLADANQIAAQLAQASEDGARALREAIMSGRLAAGDSNE